VLKVIEDPKVISRLVTAPHPYAGLNEHFPDGGLKPSFENLATLISGPYFPELLFVVLRQTSVTEFGNRCHWQFKARNKGRHFL